VATEHKLEPRVVSQSGLDVGTQLIQQPTGSFEHATMCHTSQAITLKRLLLAHKVGKDIVQPERPTKDLHKWLDAEYCA
jgi:hypothetical protein